MNERNYRNCGSVYHCRRYVVDWWLPVKDLTYQERLANYEREKKELLKSGNYTSEEFCWKLKELQDKWRI